MFILWYMQPSYCNRSQSTEMKPLNVLACTAIKIKNGEGIQLVFLRRIERFDFCSRYKKTTCSRYRNAWSHRSKTEQSEPRLRETRNYWSTKRLLSTATYRRALWSVNVIENTNGKFFFGHFFPCSHRMILKFPSSLYFM